MTSIGSGISLTSLASLGIDKSKLNPTKLTPEMQKQMEELWQAEFKKPADPKMADNHPSKIYATVEVNGQVVATLYNGGSSMTSNAGYGRIKNLPSMGESETLVGPALAQKRAEEIAKELGGTIKKADTPQTQAQWMASQNARNDLMNTQVADAGAKTKTDAQIIAQTSADEVQGVIDKFLDLVGSGKSAEEKMYARILAALGLTEEELQNMSPEDRVKVEEKIEAMIKQEAEQTVNKTLAQSTIAANASVSQPVQEAVDSSVTASSTEKREQDKGLLG